MKLQQKSLKDIIKYMSLLMKKKYFFVLESEGFTYDLEEIMDSRIDKDIPLTIRSRKVYY